MHISWYTRCLSIYKIPIWVIRGVSLNNRDYVIADKKLTTSMMDRRVTWNSTFKGSLSFLAGLSYALYLASRSFIRRTSCSPARLPAKKTTSSLKAKVYPIKCGLKFFHLKFIYLINLCYAAIEYYKKLLLNVEIIY